MITFPNPVYASPLCVMPQSVDCIGVELVSTVNGVAASATWIANRTIYIPWYVQEPCTVTEGFWLNGATQNGNAQVGVYDSTSGLVPGALIVAGTAALASGGANTIQAPALTDTLIRPGLKWIAFNGTSSTGTFFRVSSGTVAQLRSFGVMSETLAGGLPATATPVGTTTNEVPMFGFMLSPRTVV